MMASLQYLEQRRQMAKVARAMWDRKLTNAAGGNLALKVGKGLLLISPSMMSEQRMCDLTEEDFLLTDYDAKIHEGSGRLSREADMHILLLKNFEYIKCTIHAHPQFCMVYASQEKPIKTATEETQKRGEYFGCVEYAEAASPQLAKNVYRYFEERRELAEKIGIGCILPLHGVVVSGDSISAAFCTLELMETDAVCNLFKNIIR
ncbi:MAG: class II aldolase/adducin family protein [Bacillota bacterium]|nr:class II aldolase/adducin family protein [Bacillota bacterium]